MAQSETPRPHTGEGKLDTRKGKLDTGEGKKTGREVRTRSAPSLARWSKPPVLPRPGECIALARAALAQARQFLLEPAPESVLRCELCMREAADRLRQFPRSLARAVEGGIVNGAELYRAAMAAKEELAHLNVLHQRSAEFYAGWTRLFSLRRCGYTRTGIPASLVSSRNFMVQG